MLYSVYWYSLQCALFRTGTNEWDVVLIVVVEDAATLKMLSLDDDFGLLLQYMHL